MIFEREVRAAFFESLMIGWLILGHILWIVHVIQNTRSVINRRLNMHKSKWYDYVIRTFVLGYGFIVTLWPVVGLLLVLELVKKRRLASRLGRADEETKHKM